VHERVRSRARARERERARESDRKTESESESESESELERESARTREREREREREKTRESTKMPYGIVTYMMTALRASNVELKRPVPESYYQNPSKRDICSVKETCSSAAY